ncbi:MAG: hypothetical protein IJ165_03375 [Proteobacteria bacterium]|nr:hypothetical protein [Pseudomonadota bacterium]
MIDDILADAERIALQSSPDEAARFLASHRRQACDALQDSPANIANLLAITSAQMQFLIDAGTSDKALGIAEWFLHTLHHLEETIDQGDFIKLKRALREAFSRFFRRYARCLRDAGRIEEMRLAMRTALDLTQMLPMAIVAMLHLYMPLKTRDVLESEPSSEWLLKRCAEALAGLDFAGMNASPFRQALDEFQFALRSEENLPAARDQLRILCSENPEDITLKTLANLLDTLA